MVPRADANGPGGRLQFQTARRKLAEGERDLRISVRSGRAAPAALLTSFGSILGATSSAAMVVFQRGLGRPGCGSGDVVPGDRPIP